MFTVVVKRVRGVEQEAAVLAEWVTPPPVANLMTRPPVAALGRQSPHRRGFGPRNKSGKARS